MTNYSVYIICIYLNALCFRYVYLSTAKHKVNYCTELTPNRKTLELFVQCAVIIGYCYNNFKKYINSSKLTKN